MEQTLQLVGHCNPGLFMDTFGCYFLSGMHSLLFSQLQLYVDIMVRIAISENDIAPYISQERASFIIWHYRLF
jgi:hypothetical protein